jgi:hypothetical protein
MPANLIVDCGELSGRVHPHRKSGRADRERVLNFDNQSFTQSGDDEQSVSSWIRRAVDHELQTAEQYPRRRRTARPNAASNTKTSRT